MYDHTYIYIHDYVFMYDYIFDHIYIYIYEFEYEYEYIYIYTLRVLHVDGKDSSFSDTNSRGSVLLLCCTTGAVATAQLHVQMPNRSGK